MPDRIDWEFVNSWISATSPFASWIMALATAVIAVGTVFLAFAARRGLTTWREQARAVYDHDLASRLLRRAYAIQQTVSHARDLLKWSSDIAASLDLRSADGSEYGKQIREIVMSVHGTELERTGDGELQLDLRETTLRWGVRMEEFYAPLIRRMEELRWALGISPFATEFGTAASSGAADDRAWVSRWRQIVNGAMNGDVSKEIDSAVAQLEECLLPYMWILP